MQARPVKNLCRKWRFRTPGFQNFPRPLYIYTCLGAFRPLIKPPSSKSSVIGLSHVAGPTHQFCSSYAPEDSALADSLDSKSDS